MYTVLTSHRHPAPLIYAWRVNKFLYCIVLWRTVENSRIRESKRNKKFKTMAESAEWRRIKVIYYTIETRAVVKVGYLDIRS